jgi:hypothetical protein
MPSANPPRAVKAVMVEWRPKAGGLELTYRVEGRALALPASAVPARADNLWKTTCFELFLGQAGTTYREFNFSPSGQWATYAFAAYRESGHDAPMPLPPAISLERAAMRWNAGCCCRFPRWMVRMRRG